MMAKKPVRARLFKAFEKFSEPRVNIENCGAIGSSCSAMTDKSRYWGLLINSSFVLEVRGHGRWNPRLYEVICACSIPVIMVDGLTLAFEEVIDWSNAVIWAKEDLADNATALLAKLPRDLGVIRQMKKRVCEIRDKYLSSKTQRFQSLLLALGKRRLIEGELDNGGFSRLAGGKKENHGTSAAENLAWRESLGFVDVPNEAWVLRRERHIEQMKIQNSLQSECPRNVYRTLKKCIPGCKESQNITTKCAVAEFFQTHFEPTFSCEYEKRIGIMGEGGKWVCDPTRSRQLPVQRLDRA